MNKQHLDAVLRCYALPGMFVGHNGYMDEKRELLMKLLFGDGESQSGGNSSAISPDQLQKWQKAQEKAQKINETLDDSEKSAEILREMMHKE